MRDLPPRLRPVRCVGTRARAGTRAGTRARARARSRGRSDLSLAPARSRSDLDDSVGYWFVQPTGAEECRVYYACDTTLRGWVPGPVYNLLGKTALKQTTTWVNEEALKEWSKLSRKGGANR